MDVRYMNSYNRYFRLLPAIACLVCGLMLAGNPAMLARGVCRIIGIIALVAGVSELADSTSAYSVRSRGSSAILSVIIAVVLIFMPGLVLRSISLIAGIIIGVLCLHSLMASLEARALGRHFWPYAMGLSIAGIVVGVIMMFGGISATTLVIRLIGIALVIGGARMLVGAAASR